MSTLIASTMDANKLETLPKMMDSLRLLLVQLEDTESIGFSPSTVSLPPTVSSSLSASEQQIDDLSQKLYSEIGAYIALKKSLIDESFNLVRTPSSASPISRCPDDVLGDIFEELIEDGSHRLQPLLTVNKQFNRLVMSNPRLWRKISIAIDKYFDEVNSLSTSYVDACLQRSEEVMLDITVDCLHMPDVVEFLEERILRALNAMNQEEGKGDIISHVENAFNNLHVNYDIKCLLYDQKTDNVMKIVDALMGPDHSNLHRWKSAIINTQDPAVFCDMRGVFDIFSGRLPNLQSLRIEGAHLVWLSQLLPNSPWPKVTELAITGYINSFKTSLNLVQLQRLEFEYVVAFDGSSDLAVLSECISLQELSIHCEHHQECHPPIDIHLPRLRSLTLHGVLVTLREVRFILPKLEHWSLVGAGVLRYVPDIDAPRVSVNYWATKESLYELPNLTNLLSRFKETISLTLEGLGDPESCIIRISEMKAHGLLPKSLKLINIVGVALIDLT